MLLMVSLAKSIIRSNSKILHVCLFSSLVGSLVELNFYPGFFSEILAVEIGLALVLPNCIKKITDNEYAPIEKEADQLFTSFTGC